MPRPLQDEQFFQDLPLAFENQHDARAAAKSVVRPALAGWCLAGALAVLGVLLSHCA